MHFSRLFQTSTFRLHLIYLGLFSISMAILLMFSYWVTTRYMHEQVDQSIEAELGGLVKIYDERSLIGLISTLKQRVAHDSQGNHFVYFLRTSEDVPVVETADMPMNMLVNVTDQGWLNVGFEGLSGKRFVRMKVVSLPGGVWKFGVGRNLHDMQLTQRAIRNALGQTLLIMLGLALVGSSMMSWSVIRRIEAINQTSRTIVHGDLGQRIPTDGSGDDFDQLAVNLNEMLDQIQVLMNGIRQVTDNIAHDLRTPLSRLRNRLERLQQCQLSGGVDEGGIELAIGEADRLLATFNALLRISTLEAGGDLGKTTLVNLNALVLDATELYEAVAQDKSITFSVRLGDSLSVQGNRDLLFQAVVNLLDNAVKYTPEGGRIEIGLQRAGDKRIELVVADSGAGIPAAFRDKVLQRFYRLEESRHTSGNGLGLSLVAAVAKWHHAQLRLEDNVPVGLRVVLGFAFEE